MVDCQGERDEQLSCGAEGLGGEIAHDSGNFAPDLFQQIQDRGLDRDIDTVSESYKVAEICLVFKVRSSRTNRVYDAVFSSSFNVLKKLDFCPRREDRGFVEREMRLHITADQQSMLCLPAKPVECPNNVSVPSFVRLEPAKDRVDIRWERALMPALPQKSVKSRFRVRDGEVNLVSDGGAMSVNDCKGGAVEAGSKVGYGVEGAIGEDIGHWAEPDLVEYVRSARVYLSDRFKGISVEVGAGGDFKVTDMFICAS